jgi:hypothetical protein
LFEKLSGSLGKAGENLLVQRIPPRRNLGIDTVPHPLCPWFGFGFFKLESHVMKQALHIGITKSSHESGLYIDITMYSFSCLSINK